MIRLLNVCKSFGSNDVLKDVNVTIYKGQVTFIIGSSGAGKTTLLNLIGGLDKVSSGKIYLDQIDIGLDLDEYRAKKVGFIFQDFNLISGLSVEKNIEIGQLLAEKNDFNFEKNLHEVGINKTNQKSETLSGGEKQRVAFIRSIAKNPDIIIADEPTGNLDSSNAEIVMQLISEMKKDKHIVVVSHDMDMARKYADRIIKISDGKIVEDTNTESVNVEEIKLNNNKKDDLKDKKELILNKLKTTRIIGINSVKRRFSKLFSIALVIAMAISMIALIFVYNKLGDKVSKDVNVNYLESDMLSLFYDYTANLSYKKTPFEQDIIMDVQSKYKPNDVVEVYMETDSLFFNNGDKICEANIKQVNIDDFFKERIMSYDIEGDFLIDDNSIIISKDVVDKLGLGNCIGKTISLNDGTGESVEVNIVGINSTVNPFDEIYSVVSAKKIKELYDKNMMAMLATRVEIDEFKEEKIEGDIVVSTSGAYASINEFLNNEEILYGDYPTDKNEIIISDTVLPYILSAFELGEVEISNVHNGVNNTVLSQLFDKPLVLKHNGIHMVRIVGIYSSSNIEIKAFNEMIDELKNTKPLILEVYASENYDVSKMKNDINANKEYICFLQLEDLKNNVSQQTNFFKVGITIMGIILIMISIFMLGSFIKIVTLERTKEIGILKSLGMTNRHLTITLGYDAIIIASFAFALSLIFSKILIDVIPKFLDEIRFVAFEYPVCILLGINIVTLFFVWCYTIMGMKKIIKKTPAELLKE